GLGRRREEVSPAAPLLGLLPDHQSHIGFMDQGGGLEGLAGLFLGHPLGRQLPQLVVNERQELPRGARIAFLNGGQDAGDVIHASPGYASPPPPARNPSAAGGPGARKLRPSNGKGNHKEFLSWRRLTGARIFLAALSAREPSAGAVPGR